MAPKHTPKGKKNVQKGASQTPDVRKQMKPSPLRKTPKSAPQAKRKKLSEEIDEHLSDNDFDEILLGMKKSPKDKGNNGKAVQIQLDSDGGSEESDEEVADESEASMESDEDDEEEHKLQEAIKAKLKEKAKVGQKRKVGNDSPVKAKEPKLSDVSDTDAKIAQDARSERDRKTLFMKNLPNNVTEDQIKSLCSDIVHCRLRFSNKRKAKNRGYAFLEFIDESTAEKHYKSLKSKKIGDCDVIVDYVGTKSGKGQISQISTEDLDPLKLYVTGFPSSIAVADLKKCFPTASKVTLPFKQKNNKPLGYGFIHFEKETTCKAALNGSQGKELKGNKLVVVYGKKTVFKPQTKNEKKLKQKAKSSALTTNTKTEKKRDSEGEESDDDEEAKGSSNVRNQKNSDEEKEQDDSDDEDNDDDSEVDEDDDEISEDEEDNDSDDSD